MKNEHIGKAEVFLAEYCKWGHQVYMPFDSEAMAKIIRAYQDEAERVSKAHESEKEAIHAAHQNRIAELTGSIGGMQKKINELSKK